MVAANADRAAQKDLQIYKTFSGPNKQTVTGYRSGTGNQMYGTQYQEARGKYLEKQGLATGRTVNYGPIDPATGKGRFSYTAYDPAVQTDKGLTFTDATRGAFNATKNINMPLSRQMYDSQQKFKMAVLGGATLLSGMPSFFTAGLMSNQPYEQYVQNRESGNLQRNVIQNNRTKNTKNNQNNNQTTYRQTGGDASVMEEVQKRNQKLANTAASTAASTRNFYASAGKSIKAKKISSFA